jgi:hypothetical protein
MAQSTLKLPNAYGSSAAGITYIIRDSQDRKVQYVGNNTGDSLAAPRIFDVQLDIKAPGVTGNDRVYVSAKQVVLDSDNLPHTGSVSVTVSIPRVQQWTAAHTTSLLSQIASYIGGFVNSNVTGSTDTTGNPDKIASGIVP